MANFPSDFDPGQDTGGMGRGNPLGGFGGAPGRSRAYHQEFIRSSGKAPIVLVHGNSGTATHPQWGWLKVIQELKRPEFGYADEHLWALSYLGEGQHQLKDPYSSNIDDLRTFADNVRAYLDVECIDMVGHSLGCFLILCYLAGLKKQSDPIVFDQGQRYANVGSVILIDGALKGLSQFALPIFSHDTFDEWIPDHPIYRLLSPDNTPFGKNDTSTPPPEHHLTYWCGMVPGGYVDNLDNNKRTTGHLTGADANQFYEVGWGAAGHEKVKDEPAIIRDWASYLNSMPPPQPVTLTIDPPDGSYDKEMVVTVSVRPENRIVSYEARRVTKKIIAGIVQTEAAETLHGDLAHGKTLSLENSGMWEVAFRADGAPNVRRTYWIDASRPYVEIITDNSVPFSHTLQVQAETDMGALFMTNGPSDETGWLPTAVVPIQETSVIRAMAITATGVASDIVLKKFEKMVIPKASGTATEHYIAGRLDTPAYLNMGSKYGYLQGFTLYYIDGVWTDDPDTSLADTSPPKVSCSHESGAYSEPIEVSLSAIDDGDPAPKIFYTTDGSTPTMGSPCFVNRGVIRLTRFGEKSLKFFARDRSGNTTPVEQRSYHLEIIDPPPIITADVTGVDHLRPITVTISARDDIDDLVRVYYTLDGSVPDKNSPFFENTKEFHLIEPRNHAISCYAVDSTSNEKREIFFFVVHDTQAPETKIFPDGGIFSHQREVSLSSSEAVEWIKYTLDGSTPDESNGHLYQTAFTLFDSTVVKYRSKDKNGNLEAVKSAEFILQKEPHQAVFENIADIDGYIKATAAGDSRSVVDDVNLAVGAGWDGMISRAIVSFDTSSIPQRADITRAYLQVRHSSGYGNPWAYALLKIDVNHGKFGTDTRCQTGDWDETSTAKAAAVIDAFERGSKDSSDFTAEGAEAINRNGRTQMRIYFDPHDRLKAYNYIFLEKGAEVRLFVEYTD